VVNETLKEGKMKKFLCATDHSEIAQKAEVFAAHYAKSFEADLTYAYVSLIREEDVNPKPAHSSVDILKEAALKEHRILTHARKVGEEAGLSNVNCVVLRSRVPAYAIVDYAEKEGFDQIIIGSADRAGFARMTLGSISSLVVVGAHCPVTVVR
jgi:nucleotide-binding universal stress UspA family protein